MHWIVKNWDEEAIAASTPPGETPMRPEDVPVLHLPRIKHDDHDDEDEAPPAPVNHFVDQRAQNASPWPDDMPAETIRVDKDELDDDAGE